MMKWLTVKRIWQINCVLAVVAVLCAMYLPGQVEAQQQTQGETISRCGTQAPTTIPINTATSANVELVALVAGKSVYVCGVSLDNDTATTGLQFIYGTGTACATG